MKIVVNQKTEIKWKAPSDTRVDNTVADCRLDKLFQYSSSVVPNVGNFITYDDCKYSVIGINYVIDVRDNLIDYIEITVSPQVYYINYYDYMKLFTHCCDGMKGLYDPTRTSLYKEYYFVKPKTIEEWLEDKQILESSPSDGMRMELVNRRSSREECNH